MHTQPAGALPLTRKSNKRARGDDEWPIVTKKEKKTAKQSKRAFKHFLDEEDTIR